MLIGDWLREWLRMRKARKLFDAKFYLERYPDVRQAGMNPLLHYLRYGGAEGRKPNRLFEPEYYLRCCPEARNHSNPLLHFIETGGRSGNPHPLFDCEAYLAAYPDVAERGVNPLVDYVAEKRGADRKPLPHGRGSVADARGSDSDARGSNRSHDREGVVAGKSAISRPRDASVLSRMGADEGIRLGRLEIFDVEVEVEFWEDDSGRMNFIAEPQQKPFFLAMRFDQLAAQITP